MNTSQEETRDHQADTICLVDLGAEFWNAWFATLSEPGSFDLCLESLRLYARAYTRVIVCADSPRSVRREMHESYKSNRKPKPPEALVSLRSVIARVRAWGMPIVQVDGQEADDVIATLTLQAWPQRVHIASRDKDLTVLICETVSMVSPKLPLVDVNAVYEKYGVPPSSMTDWLCLVGDTADGIAGCKGCGPQRATDLLERFGTIEGIKSATAEELSTVEGIGPKTVTALLEWDPEKARSLVRLHTDLPISLSSLLKPT